MGKLAKTKKDSLTTSVQSDWSERLKRLLVLACQATGKDVMPGMERLFEATLRGYSTTEIEEGFRLYFAEPQDDVFLPKPGEIAQHIERLRERKAFDKQSASTDSYLAELRRTRKTLKSNGHAYGPEQFNQVVRMGAEIVERIQKAKQVEFDPAKRRAELEEQRRKVMDGRIG